MTRYGLLIDVTRCTGCFNCLLACKDEHCGHDYPGYSAPQPMTGHFWMNIVEKERGQFPRVKLAYTPVPCQHCQAAPCVKAARDGAVYRRPDGVVVIDPVKARGQKQIIAACPYGAIYWNEEADLPQKCGLCAHLLDAGWKEPRCAEACPTGAICFGDTDDPASDISHRLAAGATETLHPEYGLKTAVVYRGLPQQFIAGTVVFGDTDECAGDVRVFLSGGEMHRTARTNSFGDFEFEGLTPGGDYRVRVESSGYVPRNFAVRTDKDIYLGEIILSRLP